MKIAVLNCKAAKQKFPCSVREMYQPSRMFRNQLAFIEKHYDSWILLSTKFGPLLPTDIIEPYNMTFDRTGKTKLARSYGYGENYKQAERPDNQYKKAWAERE